MIRSCRSVLAARLIQWVVLAALMGSITFPDDASAQPSSSFNGAALFSTTLDCASCHLSQVYLPTTGNLVDPAAIILNALEAPIGGTYRSGVADCPPAAGSLVVDGLAKDHFLTTVRCGRTAVNGSTMTNHPVTTVSNTEVGTLYRWLRSIRDGSYHTPDDTDTVSLGAAAAGGATVAQVITVRNNRSVAGRISFPAAPVSPAAPGAFAIDPATTTCVNNAVLGPSTSVTAPLPSCNIGVIFQPPTGTPIGPVDGTFTPTVLGNANPALDGLTDIHNLSIKLNGQVQLARPAFESVPSLSFPAGVLAGPVSQGVTIKNADGSPNAVRLGQILRVGTAPEDYSASACVAPGGSIPTSLAPGATCTITVTFTPTVIGPRNAVLRIESPDADPALISLLGSGAESAGVAVRLTPDPLPFGRLLVGLSTSKTLTLVSVGTATATISNVAIAGLGFSLTSNGCIGSFTAGQSCQVGVTFTPPSESPFNGTATVTVAGGPTATASLTGAGTSSNTALLQWSSAVTALAFGNVSVGTAPAPTQSLTLTNQGPVSARFSVINAVGADAGSFTVSGNGNCAGGLSLAVADSCQITVAFNPLTPGVKSATLQVASDGTAPTSIQLSGTGLGGPSPVLSVSSPQLDFETTRTGNASAAAELVISNDGSGVLTVQSVEVTGPFSVATKTCPALPFALAVGSRCSMAVSFVPQSEGSNEGSLTITSNGATAVRKVVLTGSGQPQAQTSGGGGGCSLMSIDDGESPVDPTLWTIALLALAALLYRRRSDRARPRAGPRRDLH